MGSPLTANLADSPKQANKRDGQPGATLSSSKVGAKQAAANAPATPGTKEAEIEAWIKAVALETQGVPSSEPPKSGQTKRAWQSVGSHEAAGGLENEVPTRSTGQPMRKKLKTSDPTKAPEAPGKTQGENASAAKQRSEAGTGEEIEDAAVMSEGDLDGVPMEVETEAAEEKVSEGEEEDGTVVSGRSRPRTATPDDSCVPDEALRYALVTEILECRPIRPRVIGGVLVNEDLLKRPLALAWDQWLWGDEFERQQAWEIQQIYGMILHRTGRDF